MLINDMQNLLDAIKSLKAAEQSLMLIGYEIGEVESQSVRMTIDNLEREAKKALKKND